MDPKTVKRIRTQAGLTQPQLAARLGVHRVTVAKWEAGALVVPKMAAILLRLYEQLMGGEDATR
jgi:DNA-binding transcriptional regulator YiaG